jgi:hypothetical protein
MAPCHVAGRKRGFIVTTSKRRSVSYRGQGSYTAQRTPRWRISLDRLIVPGRRGPGAFLCSSYPFGVKDVKSINHIVDRMTLRAPSYGARNYMYAFASHWTDTPDAHSASYISPGRCCYPRISQTHQAPQNNSNKSIHDTPNQHNARKTRPPRGANRALEAVRRCQVQGVPRAGVA